MERIDLEELPGGKATVALLACAGIIVVYALAAFALDPVSRFLSGKRSGNDDDTTMGRVYDFPSESVGTDTADSPANNGGSMEAIPTD